MFSASPRRLFARAAWCGVLVCGLAASAAQADESPKSLESLLAKTEFMVKKLENGCHRIAVERDGGVAIVLAREVTMDWKDPDGNDARRILIHFWVADTPEGFVPSQALLEKVVEISSNFQIGRIDRNDNGFYFTTGLWLRTTDVAELTHEVYIAANTGADLVEMLRPLIESSQTRL